MTVCENNGDETEAKEHNSKSFEHKVHKIRWHLYAVFIDVFTGAFYGAV